MKYMINIGALLMLFISLSSSSCHKEEHRYIYFNNSSSKSIYYGLSYAYPDTNMKKIDNVPGDNGNISHKVNPGKETTLMTAAFAINPTLQIFIFDADVIESTPWDSIVAHHMVLKRYQFIESDMGKINWTITYP